MRRLFALAGLALGLGLGLARGAPAPATPAELYAQGERLVFDLTWLGIKAGRASLEAHGLVEADGRRAYRLATRAESTPFISAFFRVDDRTESLLDADGWTSLQFTKHIREGRYRHDSLTTFDAGRRMATFRYIDYSKVPRDATVEEAVRLVGYRGEEVPVPAGIQDELSAFYTIRARPLAAGGRLTIETFASKKSHTVEVAVHRREEVGTKWGVVPTLVVEPMPKFDALFKRKGRLWIWLTDDALRIPVRVKSEAIIGSFAATLVERQVGGVSVGLGR